MASMRLKLIRLGLDAFHVLRAHRVLTSFARGRGLVLMLHRVRPASGDPFQPNAHLEVTPEFLAAALGRVRSAGIPIVGMDEAARRLADPADGSRFVVVTFDDGYRDNYEHAWPILKAAGAPFTIFVATGLVNGTANFWWATLEEVVRRADRIRVDRDGTPLDLPARTPGEKHAAMKTLGRWIEPLPESRKDATIRALAETHGVDIPALLAANIMDWNEIAAMAADPLVTIGGHTVSHPALARLPATAALREMVDGAAEIGRRLGRRPVHFAYPYGYARAAGQREFELAARAGFRTAVTTRPGMLPRAQEAAGAMTALPRLSLNGNFQSVRYLDVFLSGAPFAIHAGLKRIARTPALASTIGFRRRPVHPFDEVAGRNDP